MKKVSEFDRKVVMNLSVAQKIKTAFEQYCEKLDLNKNLVAEELFSDFINKRT